MKILAILPRIPFPLKDGGAIAIYNLLDGLAKSGVSLRILSYNTTKHFVDPLPAEVTRFGRIETVTIDNQIKPIDALLNLFSSESYHISRFVSDEFEDKLTEVLKEETFDVIHFDNLITAPYLSIARSIQPNAVCALRQHNVEYQIWERIAEGASVLKKWYVSLLARRLKAYEETQIPLFDAIIPITPLDGLTFEKIGAKNQHVCPVGVDPEKFTVSNEFEDNTVFHLGSLDWMPNQEGVKWFVEYVWPLVLKEQPNAKFHIAGRYVPAWINAYDGHNQIVVDGEVPDAKLFMASKGIMVVPLKSGSGMRVKIIEGFAQGKAIVSTGIGAEGINYKDGEHIEIADDAKEISEKIINLLKDRASIVQLGQSARKLVEEQYSNKSTVSGLLEFYKTITNGNS